MFKTIFSFEFKRWIKGWQFYLYASIFFFLGLLLMGSGLGFFDAVTVTTTSSKLINTPLVISQLIEGANNLLYFLFPTIIGASIYRDYKYNAHQILYSYPFTKTNYLLGKFLSAFSITFIISLFIGLGVFVATLMPMANPELLGPNLFWNYAQAYLLNVIPNMLLIGIIVFAVTTLSRSVYVGFISVIAVLVILGVVNSIASDMDNEIVAMLIDPSGMQALQYYTKYWTVAEFNTNNLPIEKWYLINRAIWLGVALVFAAILFALFNFSEQPLSLKFWGKKEGERATKSNLVGLHQILLPKVKYNYSLKTNWSNVLNFTRLSFNFLIKNRAFLILVGIGVISMISIGIFSNTLMGTKTLPVTRNMLSILSGSFMIFIITNTFLGAGLLIHRGRNTNMNELVDVTPTPNWVFFISNFFALILMQILLLVVIIVSGVFIQSYFGYYQFEIGLYLKSLLGITLISYIIWAGLAMAVQTLFKNYIVGFFILILFFLFGGMYSRLGVEQSIFFFNQLPTPSYSDLNGFGSGLPKYFVYVTYWMLFIGFISGLTLMFWQRGVFSFKERFHFAKKRATPKIVIPTILCLGGFLALGGYLYYENTIKHPYYSAKERELMQVEYEKKFKSYEEMVLPRIVDVKVDLDLYPKSRDFEASGVYVLKNKNAKPVDSLMVSFNSRYLTEIKIENAEFLSKDTLYGYSFYRFNQPLDSGAVAKMEFTIKNKPNTILRNNSPVIGNGTFMNNSIFPSLGYSNSREISSSQLREKYDLPPKERMADQDDLKARQNTYIRDDSDWITFETTVSTDEDQIAIAPGYLQKEWVEGGRKYFHYSMGDQKILNFFAYNSGTYEVARDKWEDIDIEIYYSKKHPYNVDRMISSLKKSFDYFTTEFSPYQFKQARIIEFPSTHGSFAQSFANTIPFSENIGFIADVDDEDEDGVDYPFAVTSHELAHQWWAHQVIGANVKGATMLSESLSEYSSLKVLEHEYGKGQMQKFLKESLDSYLSGRSFESEEEQPLMYNENQQYIHYRKGSLVFYTLSDYMGEKELNKVLSQFIDKVAFQEAPHATAGELVEDLRAAVPDSLQYMIKDMFETITLYDNYLDSAEARKLEDGTYEVDLKAIVSKYRAGEKGKRIYVNTQGDSLVYLDKRDKEIKSLPLQDYVELGIFASGEDKESGKTSEKILYLERVKITDIENDFKIIVKEEPSEAGIDPYNKLIDTRSNDNRRNIVIKKEEEKP